MIIFMSSHDMQHSLSGDAAYYGNLFTPKSVKTTYSMDNNHTLEESLMSVKNDRSKKNYVSCPFCGKQLFKGRIVEGMEIQCPKCKSGLLVYCTDSMVQVKEAEMNCRAD